MSVVVGLVTIFIINYINALTRRRQIGILKALGVSPLAIEFSYVFQALFYVFVGSILALLIVFFALIPLSLSHPLETPFASIVLAVDLVQSLLRLVLVLVVSIIAGYVPARLIVNTNTLNAILGRDN
jgi:putative ABC transport system permease protein